MLSKPLTFLALATTYALALPANDAPEDHPPAFGDSFGCAATGINIVNKDLTASDGFIYIGGTQSPSCEKNQRQDFATFVYQSDGTVFLYKHGNPPQQVWVDASGMGQGITGYSTGTQNPKPKNASYGKFHVDGDGKLTFNDTGAKACPTGEQGKWSVWFTQDPMPANQEGCVSVNLKAYHAPARVACNYTVGN